MMPSHHRDMPILQHRVHVYHTEYAVVFGKSTRDLRNVAIIQAVKIARQANVPSPRDVLRDEACRSCPARYVR